MQLRKLYTITFFILTACFNHQLLAQSTSHNLTLPNWVAYLTNFEEDVYQSIFSLKNAEAAIKDSATAVQLEKLGYLTIIQSGFKSTLKDNYNRSGYWMLPYPVAVKYGLTVNAVIDERNHLEKSTQAAYQYWSNLKATYTYDSIADLVFIESAISIAKYAHDSVSYPAGYNQLSASRAKLAKVKKIYLESSVKSVEPVEPTVVASSSNPISFQAIHHFLQIPTSELMDLNPQWVSNMYNPLYGKLLLPSIYKDKFEKQLQAMEQKTRDDVVLLAAANTKRLNQLKGDIPDLKTYKPIRYKVKMGDNLGRIAQRYRVKIASIRSWNELKSDRIYAGQKLTIYIPLHQKPVAEKAKPKPIAKSNLTQGEYQEYTVKQGDTLWGISQLYEDINADMIMEDNGINTDISPGQVLKIRKLQ